MKICKIVSIILGAIYLATPLCDAIYIDNILAILLLLDVTRALDVEVNRCG